MNVIIWLIMSTSISQAPLNIVYLHSHDTGRYIQPYGYALQTPHMQKFAEQGVLFRQAFCVGPTCSPSRAGLLTGQSSHSSGMLGLAHRGWGLTDYKQHLLHTLKAQGYHTALAGLQHIAHGPECATKVIGYDQAIPWNNSYAQVTANAITILRERKDKNQPFFLSAGYLLTHRTNKKGESVQWHCHEDSPLGDSRYVMPPAPLPDTPITRKDFADFAVSAKRLDDQYGQILQTLEDTGLAKNTLVIITTDHGIAFPHMKCNLTDHGTGVLLMMRGPQASGFTGGKVVDSMVSHIDVFPTLCDLLGIAKPSWLQGRSFMPVITGQADAADPDAIRSEVFSEVTYHAAYEPKRGIRTRRYQYIRNYPVNPQRRGPILPNIDNSVSKTLLHEQDWCKHVMPIEELYDLTFDPQQRCNRIDDPALAEVKTDLSARLDRWMQETSDPLIHGHVPLPTGGITTNVDAYSPGG